jgi:hypothetical protein
MVSGGSEGWAVGGSGTILHYTGGSWSSYVSSPTPNDLRSIYMVSTSEGWAVGVDILHYTGTSGSWNRLTNPTFPNVLLSVYMVSASEGWAVGGSGTILHYTGGSWSTVTSPTSNDLYSVYMVSGGSEGWAVGGSGTILHYTVSAPPPPPLAGALTVTVFVKDSATGLGISGATIFFDGVMQPGTSNVMGMLTVTCVGPGTHTVTASNIAAGYPLPASAVTFYVTRSTSVAVPLTYVGTNTVTVQVLDVNTEAGIPNAMVYIDGAYVGTTDSTGALPFSLTLRSGPHTFVVVCSGYITNTQTSSSTSVTIYLTPR